MCRSKFIDFAIAACQSSKSFSAHLVARFIVKRHFVTVCACLVLCAPRSIEMAIDGHASAYPRQIQICFLRSYIHNLVQNFLAIQKEIFMPMSACHIKENFYAKSALLQYSKGSFYADDFGIRPPCVTMLSIIDES